MLMLVFRQVSDSLNSYSTLGRPPCEGSACYISFEKKRQLRLRARVYFLRHIRASPIADFLECDTGNGNLWYVGNIRRTCYHFCFFSYPSPPNRNWILPLIKDALTRSDSNVIRLHYTRLFLCLASGGIFFSTELKNLAIGGRKSDFLGNAPSLWSAFRTQSASLNRCFYDCWNRAWKGYIDWLQNQSTCLTTPLIYQ